MTENTTDTDTDAVAATPKGVGGWLAGFMLVAGAFAGAFIADDPNALLLIPAAAGVALIVASTVRASRTNPVPGPFGELPAANSNRGPDVPSTNPATGLPMVGRIDIGGNTYGMNNAGKRF